MITVHHLGVSQSERIVWLCEELGIRYALKHYERDAVTKMAPPEYRALHPMGIAPVITDGALVLGESGAIIEYLIGKYGKGHLAVGPQDPAYADYLFWFHFANGTMMPSEMVRMIVQMLNIKADGSVLGLLLDRSRRAFEMVEARLGVVPYFAGEQFTAADIMMLFPLTTMRAFAARDIASLPNLKAYLRRIGERSAYQRAMSKGDPNLQPILS